MEPSVPRPTATPPARIAVVGLGSIGGVIAGALGAVGCHDVVACVRRPLARLAVAWPERTVTVALRALTDPAAASPVDWVLLCTKTHQTPSSAPWLARLCARGTRVAVLQNGIDHVARVAPLVGDATVVPTLVYYNGERLAADHVQFRRASGNDLVLHDDADGRAFAALVDGTPLRVQLSADFTTLAWRKLLLNAAANPVTALALQRQSVLRRADVQALCRAVLDEAVAVGRAEGADLADDETARTMDLLLTFPPDAGTSMYFDRLAGRPLEADALIGPIVAAGERHGIATPLNTALLTVLRAISDAAAPGTP
jgi:2-dehydropantoate 2-reductase